MSAQMIRDVGDTSERDVQARQRPVELLTAVYDTYARLALQELCQGKTWHTWQVLAEQVVFRIASLVPDVSRMGAGRDRTRVS